MKLNLPFRFWLFLLMAILFSSVANAQLDNVAKQNIPTTAANAGKLLTEFTSALKPTSFTDAWTGEKNGWLSKAGKVSDAAGIASSVSSLAGFIKPGMFKQGFNAQSILKTANTVKTMADATGLLKTFQGGLKPEAFTSDWAKQKAGWLSALNLLKG